MFNQKVKKILDLFLYFELEFFAFGTEKSVTEWDFIVDIRDG